MVRYGVQERTVRLKKWDNRDQSYDGEFLGDSLHGQGTYRWNKTEVYEGGFFSNQKEGYADLSFSNNSFFEGLFIKNRPFGPGILSYSNGRQDVGFWVGQKLVRLSRPVDFIVPRLAPTSAAKIKLLQFRRLITLNEKNNDSASYVLKKCGCSPDQQYLLYSNVIYDSRSIFFNYLAFDKTFFIKASNFFENLFGSIYPNKSEVTSLLGSKTPEHGNKKQRERNPKSDSKCICTLVMEYNDIEDSFDMCSESNVSTNNQLGLLGYYSKCGRFKDGERRRKEESVIFEEEDEETSLPTQIVSWNRSELCTEMLKQIFRHRTFEAKLNFKIAKLMLGVRTEFRKTGEKERECLQLLKMCSLGPAYVVKDLLCQYDLSEELMDSRGNTSLMFAAAADQHDVIDILLDYGVDVNTFNDEGLTPLNLCLLRRLAQIKNICSWETAFLPTEIQRVTVTENNIKDEGWEDVESIESLDRIFGDGMSADTKTGISDMLEGDAKEAEQERNTTAYLCCHQTRIMKAEFVPKSIRRDEFEQSVRCSPEDRYLFDLTFEPPQVPVVEVGKKKTASRNKKTPKEVDNTVEDEEEMQGESEMKEVDLALVEKLEQIDKTIEKLLIRGADPNISEVPKPSIHLGVFMKDVKVVSTLLQYGASPNCQTYPNEGLLTPLHVVALLKSAPENVEICRILLNAGPNLELETSPDFSIYEGEDKILDNLRGRTPLQLLCMRPDLESADQKAFQYITQIGLMLAKYSDIKHFYKGHSYLSLAMMTGNIKLLEVLLNSNYYDPNESLGEDLGTVLHVLVSTDFQKKTIYPNSVKMCDLLLSAKADPLREYNTSPKLVGTCLDYGYREIEKEKAARKGNGSDKKEAKSSKQEKDKGRDHLKDHIKVVDYLGKKADEMKKALIRTQSDLDRFNEEKRRRQSGKQKGKESDALNVNENVGPSQKVQGGSKSKGENQPNETEDARKSEGKDKTGKSKRKGKPKEKPRNLKKGKKQKGGHKDKKGKKKGKRDSSVEGRKRTLKVFKSFSVAKNPAERFPENLRQSILEVFGNCVNIDVNQLLLPYVVLRNGDLYYRFEGQGPYIREQYSLI